MGVALYLFLGVPTQNRTLHQIQGDAERGAYVLRLAGCVACHTSKDAGEKGFLSGGEALQTPFGAFFGPNITSDADYGIGSWSLDDFSGALVNGVAPDGAHYYPAFPFTFYARLSDQDVVDLWAYMQTVPPVSKPSKAHRLSWPFDQRLLMAAWKTLFLSTDPVQTDESKTDSWNRGAYIVEGPGHCGACHSPRGPLGNIDGASRLTGSIFGPDDEATPAIDRESLKESDWIEDDLFWLLQIGVLPDGDVIGSTMGEVVDDSTGNLTDDDLRAIAEYLLSP
tara:strand:- start:753 stop:1595 length:843 start_codon:yes stop_codon:yes gene_type:complete